MSNMVEVRVAEAEGAVLGLAVAKAIGATFRIETFVYRGQHGTQESDAGDYIRVEGLGHFGSMWAAISLDRHAIHPAWRATSDKIWRPSTDWAQGGPLIERYRVTLEDQVDDYAAVVVGGFGYGKTHLIAAMRAIVVAELGERVAVPAELVAHNNEEDRQ